jgi:tetrapyrrole methylase family protein/MazG family protein
MSLNYAALLPVLERLGDRAGSGIQIMDGKAVAAQHYPTLNPDQPTLLAGLVGRDWAQDLVEALLKVYGPEHQVTLIAAEREDPVALAGLATAAGWGEAITVFVPPLARPGTYTVLQDVVARLRAPDGCPWDRELTWDKLRAFLLEETYELLAALDAQDAQKVAEEQGDLLLQIALQTEIAVEEGKFRSGDVIAGIVEKLIRRHPHVFGDTVVSGTDEVLANWEAIKRAERAGNGDAKQKRSPLAGIPAGLPALAQAEAYLDRVSRLEAIDVPAEPCNWLVEAVEAGSDLTPDMVGRALFGLVAWARARGIDAESSLRAANAAYAARIAD